MKTVFNGNLTSDRVRVEVRELRGGLHDDATLNLGPENWIVVAVREVEMDIERRDESPRFL